MLELLDEKKFWFVNDFGLFEYDVLVLIVEVENVVYFEVVVDGCNGKLLVNWVINEFFGCLKKDDKGIMESLILLE